MADVGAERARSILRGERVAQTFAALSYPNYRLWFIGQLVSLAGTWMQTTAQAFLIYQLTGSPAYLGLVGFAGGVPSWFFMLYGGVIADRLPRRTLLVITQSAMMVMAFILAALTFAGIVEPWQIIVLAFGVGVATAFDAPARQSFVLEMVEREHMSNAIALNSSMFQMATVVGPTIAGLLYAWVGPAWCFLINAFSYLAVIIALLLMKIDPAPVKARVKSAAQDLKEGLRYVGLHEIIRTMVLVTIVVSLFGMAYVTLMPAWAVDVLGGNAATNGLMQSARGLGAMFGALLIAALGNFHWRGKLLSISMFAFPVLLLAFSFVTWTPLSLLVLVGIGFSFMVLFNLINIVLQGLVTDELRGRVMSVYMLTIFGGMPLGALWAGALAEQIGEPLTVVIGAVISLIFAGFVYWKIPKVRQLQ